MTALGEGLPVLERIRRTLIALRMPRALEVLDHAVHNERAERSGRDIAERTGEVEVLADIAERPLHLAFIRHDGRGAFTLCRSSAIW
jgi:hypothetical protein